MSSQDSCCNMSPGFNKDGFKYQPLHGRKSGFGFTGFGFIARSVIREDEVN